MARGKRQSQREFAQRMKNDPALRRKTFERLCAHVRAGFSLDCFSDMSKKSVEEYLERYSEEFCKEELEKAMREGKAYWETLGVRQSNGTCMGNSRTWFYNMAHRYAWSDRVDVKAEHTGSVAVQVVSYSTKNNASNSST